MNWRDLALALLATWFCAETLVKAWSRVAKWQTGIRISNWMARWYRRAVVWGSRKWVEWKRWKRGR